MTATLSAVMGRVADAFRGIADWRDAEYRTKLAKRDSLVVQLAHRREGHGDQVDQVTTADARLRDLRTRALLDEATEAEVRAADKAATKTRQDLATLDAEINALEGSVALLDARLPDLEDDARRRNVQQAIMPQYLALLTEQIAAAKHFAEINTQMHHLVREVIAERYPEDVYEVARYRPVNNYIAPGSPRFINTAWAEFVLTGEPGSERTPIERWLAAIKRAGYEV